MRQRSPKPNLLPPLPGAPEEKYAAWPVRCSDRLAAQFTAFKQGLNVVLYLENLFYDFHCCHVLDIRQCNFFQARVPQVFCSASFNMFHRPFKISFDILRYIVTHGCLYHIQFIKNRRESCPRVTFMSR